VSARTVSALILLAAACTGAAAAASKPPTTSTPASTASQPENGPKANASALAVRIVLPGGRVIASPPATTDGTGSTGAASYAYPSNGSVVVAGKISASADANVKTTATSSASAAVENLSLFNGEITAASATAHETAAVVPGRVGGGFSGTGVSGLQALGRPHAFGRAKLGDWGYLVITAHDSSRATENGVKSYDGHAAGFEVHLTAGHGGLPAGTEIQVAYAAAAAQTAPPAVPEAGPEPADAPQLLPSRPAPLLGGVPQLVEPAVSAGPYVFPVYGATSWSDQYGTGRLDHGWQHGIDIFGGLGQPLVATATGTLYSVGWNHAAGNRLWLRDRQGNTYLYSHLSAFSTLVKNGAHVREGQVIGFMGDTGNAGGLPTHLHFELHPVSTLFLGTDGAVDPGPYLTKWKHVASLPLAVATGWAPKVPGTIRAPEPGAVPLGSTDISTGSGLDPASLRRSLHPH
jgi:murein DD-endopeptidase MepM/ murein hydrolase activator NlpD